MHYVIGQTETMTMPRSALRVEVPPRIRSCRACGAAMVFVVKMRRTSEPGHMHMFECVECEKLDFVSVLSRSSPPRKSGPMAWSRKVTGQVVDI
jgi:RNase P subunit RPR2